MTHITAEERALLNKIRNERSSEVAKDGAPKTDKETTNSVPDEDLAMLRKIAANRTVTEKGTSADVNIPAATSPLPQKKPVSQDTPYETSGERKKRLMQEQMGNKSIAPGQSALPTTNDIAKRELWDIDLKIQDLESKYKLAPLPVDARQIKSEIEILQQQKEEKRKKIQKTSSDPWDITPSERPGSIPFLDKGMEQKYTGFKSNPKALAAAQELVNDNINLEKSIKEEQAKLSSYLANRISPATGMVQLPNGDATEQGYRAKIEGLKQEKANNVAKINTPVDFGPHLASIETQYGKGKGLLEATKIFNEKNKVVVLSIVGYQGHQNDIQNILGKEKLTELNQKLDDYSVLARAEKDPVKKESYNSKIKAFQDKINKASIAGLNYKKKKNEILDQNISNYKQRYEKAVLEGDTESMNRWNRLIQSNEAARMDVFHANGKPIYKEQEKQSVTILKANAEDVLSFESLIPPETTPQQGVAIYLSAVVNRYNKLGEVLWTPSTVVNNMVLGFGSGMFFSEGQKQRKEDENTIQLLAPIVYANQMSEQFNKDEQRSTKKDWLPKVLENAAIFGKTTAQIAFNMNDQYHASPTQAQAGQKFQSIQNEMGIPMGDATSIAESRGEMVDWSPADFGQMVGPTAGLIPAFISGAAIESVFFNAMKVAGVASGSKTLATLGAVPDILETMGKTGKLTNAFKQEIKVGSLFGNVDRTTKLGKTMGAVQKGLVKGVARGVKEGITYEFVGLTHLGNEQVRDEAEFMSGFLGVPGKSLAQLVLKGGSLVVPNWILKSFGTNGAKKVMDTLTSRFGSGLGETGEEYGQTLWQLYRDSPNYEMARKEFAREFGTWNDNLHFIAATMVMGMGMGEGTAAGRSMAQSALDAYKKLDAVDKEIADKFLARAETYSWMDTKAQNIAKVKDMSTSEIKEFVYQNMQQTNLLKHSSKDSPEMSIGLHEELKAYNEELKLRGVERTFMKGNIALHGATEQTVAHYEPLIAKAKKTLDNANKRGSDDSKLRAQTKYDALVAEFEGTADYKKLDPITGEMVPAPFEDGQKFKSKEYGEKKFEAVPAQAEIIPAVAKKEYEDKKKAEALKLQEEKDALETPLSKQKQIEVSDKAKELQKTKQAIIEKENEITELIKTAEITPNPLLQQKLVEVSDILNDLKKQYTVLEDEHSTLTQEYEDAKVKTDKNGKPFRQIAKKFIGKVIYATPASGKSAFKKELEGSGQAVEDMDEYLLEKMKASPEVQELAKQYKMDITPATMADLSYKMHTNGDANKNAIFKIYQELDTQAHQLASQGKTVLTGNAKLQKGAHIVLTKHIAHEIISDGQSVDRENASDMSNSIGKIFSREKADIQPNQEHITVGEGTYVGDVLTQDNYQTPEAKKAKSLVSKIRTAIVNSLPVEISNAVTIIEDVTAELLGRNDLFLSLKEILNENGITNEILINWMGVNKDKVGNHPATIKSEKQLERIIKVVYDKKKTVSEHIELETNELARESFNNWVEALEEYPLAFRDLMLTHAIKYLNPERRSKYVLQLSKVALTNTYGILVNKPHEANRIGKLYDKEVLAGVSDVLGHEPTASGKGYWLHIPRTQNEEELYGPDESPIIKYFSKKESRYYTYDEFLGWISTDENGKNQEIDVKLPTDAKILKNNIQYNVNVELLRKVSPASWCTSSGRNTEEYVQQFDNYILIVNGITVAGIEVRPTTNEEGKWLVKEVTSVNNNLIASIDYLDDTLAFFKKHNLDLTNETIQVAIKQRALNKTDADFIDKNNFFDDDPENDFFDDDHENDFINEMEAMYENDFIDEYKKDLIDNDKVLNVQTVKEALTLIPEISGHFSSLKRELRENQQILTALVEKDPYNIYKVLSTLPFYNELAIKAVKKNGGAYRDLTEQAQALPGLAELYEIYKTETDDLPFSKTAENQIQGYYDANIDRVVVVAANTSVEEAPKIAIHEVAHRGMIRMAKDLGGEKELIPILLNAEKELMKKVPELLKRTGHTSLEALVKDYGFDINTPEGKAKLLMELAARWAETFVDKPAVSWWKEFLTSIQQWITKFTGQELSETEVNDLIGGFVKYGTKTETTSKENPVRRQTVQGELPFEEITRALPDDVRVKENEIKREQELAGIEAEFDGEGTRTLINEKYDKEQRRLIKLIDLDKRAKRAGDAFHAAMRASQGEASIVLLGLTNKHFEAMHYGVEYIFTKSLIGANKLYYNLEDAIEKARVYFKENGFELSDDLKDTFAEMLNHKYLLHIAQTLVENSIQAKNSVSEQFDMLLTYPEQYMINDELPFAENSDASKQALMKLITKQRGIVLNMADNIRYKQDQDFKLTRRVSEHEDENPNMSGAKKTESNRAIYRRFFKEIKGNSYEEVERFIYDLCKSPELIESTYTKETWEAYINAEIKKQETIIENLKEEKETSIYKSAVMKQELFRKMLSDKMGHEMFVSMQVFYKDLELVPSFSIKFTNDKDSGKRFTVALINQEDRLKKFQETLHYTITRFTYKGVENDWKTALNMYLKDSRLTLQQGYNDKKWAEVLETITGIKEEEWLSFFKNPNANRTYVDKQFIGKDGKVYPVKSPYLIASLDKLINGDMLNVEKLFTNEVGSNDNYLVQVIKSSNSKENISSNFTGVDGKRKVSFEQSSDLMRSFLDILKPSKFLENNPIANMYKKAGITVDFVKFAGMFNQNKDKATATEKMIDNDLAVMAIIQYTMGDKNVKGIKEESYLHPVGQFGDKDQVYLARVPKYTNAKEVYEAYLAANPEKAKWLMDNADISKAIDWYRYIINNSSYHLGTKGMLNIDQLTNFVYNYAINKIHMDEIVHGNIDSYMKKGAFDLTDLIKRAGSSNSPGYTANQAIKGGIGWRKKRNQQNEDIVTGFQGTKDNVDNREFNYYTLSESEAKGYGPNIRSAKVNMKNFLRESEMVDGKYKYTDAFTEIHNAFKASTGKYLDILDNTPEGLKVQNEFFKFVQGKGYNGFTTITKGHPQQDEDQYFVTFDDSSKIAPKTEVRKLKIKNLFTVTPIQAADTKAKLKASLATKFIGFGNGIQGSSTGSYQQEVGPTFANTGTYTSEDVVFVSVPGKRGNETVRNENIAKTIAEVDKALAAGAIILTDNQTYTANSSYNVGEKALAEHLKSKGISYRENTKDGQTIGIWNSEITIPEDSGTTETINPIAEKILSFKNDSEYENNYSAEIENYIMPLLPKSSMGDETLAEIKELVKQNIAKTQQEEEEERTETFTHVVLNTASLPQYLEHLSKQLDGVQLMSREWADRLGISMGSLYANLKSETNPKGIEEKLSSVKAIFSDKNRDTGKRGLTKSNVICIEELIKDYPDSIGKQLNDYMKAHNIDTLSFEDSTKKNEGEFTNAVSTKDGEFFIDVNVKPNIIERRNDHFFIQQDLRHSTTPHRAKLPTQGMANAMTLQSIDIVQKLWNDVQNEFLKDFHLSWRLKTNEAKRIWLLDKINEETMYDLYHHLENNGSINDLRYKEAIRGIVAKEIKKEALTRQGNRGAFQEVPMGLIDDLLEYRKANADGTKFNENSTESGIMKFPQVDMNIEGVRADSKGFDSKEECIAEIKANKDLYQDMYVIGTDGHFTNEISVGELYRSKNKWIIPGGLVVINRIPADDLHSHTVARLRRKLSVSNFIITDRKSQFISGSDFDGDKRYVEALFTYKDKGVTKIDMREGTKESKSNRAMLLFAKDYQNPINEDRVTRPIDLEKYNPTAKNLTEHWQQKAAAIPIGQNPITKGASKGGKLNDPRAIADARNQNNVGNRVISIVAKLSTAYEYSKKVGFTLKGNNIAIPVMSTSQMGKVLSPNPIRLTGFVKDKHGIIKNHIGIILNLALDNAKNPIIEMMGLNEVTANMFAFAIMTNQNLDYITTKHDEKMGRMETREEAQERQLIEYIDNLAAVFNTPIFQKFIDYTRSKQQISADLFEQTDIRQSLHNWAYDNNVEGVGTKSTKDAKMPDETGDYPQIKHSSGVQNLFDWLNGANELNSIGNVIDVSRESTGNIAEFLTDQFVIKNVLSNKLNLINTEKVYVSGKDKVVDPLFEIGIKNIEATAKTIFGDDIIMQGNGLQLKESILYDLFGKNQENRNAYTEKQLNTIVRTINEGFYLSAISPKKSLKMIGQHLMIVLNAIGKENNAFVNALNYTEWDQIALTKAYSKSTLNAEEKINLAEAFNNLPDIVSIFKDNVTNGFTTNSKTNGKDNRKLGEVDVKQDLVAYILAMKGNSSSTWSGNYLPYVSNDFINKLNPLIEAKREEWNWSRANKNEIRAIQRMVVNKHKSIAKNAPDSSVFIPGPYNKANLLIDIGGITTALRIMLNNAVTYFEQNISLPINDVIEGYFKDYKKDNTYFTFSNIAKDYAEELAIKPNLSFREYLDTRIAEEERTQPHINYMVPEDAAGEMLASGDPKLQEFIREHLMDMYPGVHVFESKQLFTKFIQDHYGYAGEFDMQSLGAVLGAAVHIDPLKAVQSTFFHEFAHIYWDMLPENHIVKKRMLKRFGGDMEACIVAIGKAGVTLAQEKMDDKKYFGLPAMLRDFWAAVKQVLGVQSNEDLATTFAIKIWNNKDNFSLDKFETTEMRNHIPDQTGMRPQGYDDKRKTFFNAAGSMMSSASRLIKMMSLNSFNAEIAAYNTVKSTNEKLKTQKKFEDEDFILGKRATPSDVQVYDEAKFNSEVQNLLDEWGDSAKDGSFVHQVAEFVGKGLPVPQAIQDLFTPEAFTKLVNDLKQWEYDNKPNTATSHSEVKVSDEVNMVGGIVDRVWDDNGILTVVDFKTSRKSKYEADGSLSKDYTKNLNMGLKRVFQFVEILKNNVRTKVSIAISKKFQHGVQLGIYAKLLETQRSPAGNYNKVGRMLIVPIQYEYDIDGKISKAVIEKPIEFKNTQEHSEYIQKIFDYNRMLHAETSKLSRHLPPLSHSINNEIKEEQENARRELRSYIGQDDSGDSFAHLALTRINVMDVFSILKFNEALPETFKRLNVSEEDYKNMPLSMKLHILMNQQDYIPKFEKDPVTGAYIKLPPQEYLGLSLESYKNILGNVPDDDIRLIKYSKDQETLKEIYAEIESRKVPGHDVIGGTGERHDAINRLFDMDVKTLQYFEQKLRKMNESLASDLLQTINAILSANIVRDAVREENGPTFNGYALATVMLVRIMNSTMQFDELSKGLFNTLQLESLVNDRMLGDKHMMVQYLTSEIRRKTMQVQADHVETDEMMEVFAKCDQTQLYDSVGKDGILYFKNPYKGMDVFSNEYKFLNFYYQRYIKHDADTRYSVTDKDADLTDEEKKKRRKPVKVQDLLLAVPRDYMGRGEAFKNWMKDFKPGNVRNWMKGGNSSVFWYNKLFKPQPYDNTPLIVQDENGDSVVTTFGEMKLKFNFRTDDISDLREARKIAKETYKAQIENKGKIANPPSVHISGNPYTKMRWSSTKNQDIIATHLNTLSRKHNLEHMYPFLQFVIEKYMGIEKGKEKWSTVKWLQKFGGKQIFGKSLLDTGHSERSEKVSSILKSIITLTAYISLSLNWKAAMVNFGIGQVGDLMHLGFKDYLYGWARMTKVSVRPGSLKESAEALKEFKFLKAWDAIHLDWKAAAIMKNLSIVDVTNEHSYDKSASNRFGKVLQFFAFGMTEFIENLNQGVVVASQLGNKFQAFDKEGHLKTPAEFYRATPNLEKMFLDAWSKGLISQRVYLNELNKPEDLFVTANGKVIINTSVIPNLTADPLIELENAFDKGKIADPDNLMTTGKNPYFATGKFATQKAHLKGFAIVTDQEITTIEDISRMIHGDYGIKNASPLSFNAAGQAVMQFKRWLPAMFLSYWGGGYIDRNGREQRGIMWSLFETGAGLAYSYMYNPLLAKDGSIRTKLKVKKDMPGLTKEQRRIEVAKRLNDNRKLAVDKFNALPLHEKLKSFERVLILLESNKLKQKAVFDGMSETDKKNFYKAAIQVTVLMLIMLLKMYEPEDKDKKELTAGQKLQWVFLNQMYQDMVYTQNFMSYAKIASNLVPIMRTVWNIGQFSYYSYEYANFIRTSENYEKWQDATSKAKKTRLQEKWTKNPFSDAVYKSTGSSNYKKYEIGDPRMFKLIYKIMPFGSFAAQTQNFIQDTKIIPKHKNKHGKKKDKPADGNDD